MSDRYVTRGQRVELAHPFAAHQHGVTLGGVLMATLPATFSSFLVNYVHLTNASINALVVHFEDAAGACVYCVRMAGGSEIVLSVPLPSVVFICHTDVTLNTTLTNPFVRARIGGVMV